MGFCEEDRRLKKKRSNSFIKLLNGKVIIE